VTDTPIGQGSDLIAISDVAAILSVSKQAAARIAASDDFPKPFRFNARTVRYSRAQVLAWVKSKQG
jgi:predicted DNA-binding transcriptional regulator AlpA